ncbi:DNA methyltransferase [Nitrobacter sp.]|uniref:DNA methyltransferase n=1 Tax=Nitrobacter sp. TaxID=29420 RepID=UPI0029CAC177|nr:DNA methyltransferase [Nitrobacter sp.]
MTDHPSYLQFLEGKCDFQSATGFEVDPGLINPRLKDHIRKLVPWSIRGGRRAHFLNFGMGKTSLQVEKSRLISRHTGEPAAINIPLGVRLEFFMQAAEHFSGEHEVELKFIRSRDEMVRPKRQGRRRIHPVYLTNYETIRDGRLDPSAFISWELDEAAVLRDYGSKTFQEYLPLFSAVAFKGVNTAIPAPNRLKEIIHYAGFLGVMDTGQALTRFFQRNSEKANDLTLYPHKIEEFWRWVSTWAVCARRPSDLGCSDDGYILPPLNVRWHEIPSNHAGAGTDRDGQALMFRDPAIGVQHAAAEKRDSLTARVAKMAELRAAEPSRHVVLWHDLEDERAEIERVIPGAVSVYGTMPLEDREERLQAFMEGRITDLATKPILNGSGANFQKHCSWEIFAGVGHKFHDYLQAIHRVWRFGQSQACDIDIIHTEAERPIVEDFKRKWAEHEEMQDKLCGILREFGLDHAAAVEPLKRTIGVDRIEASGERFVATRNDCVDETVRMSDATVDLIVTSIPFANQYEYTPSYNDFGHTDSNDAFWRQMDYLTPHLFRILQPGRLACIHVKDRILFGNVTGQGVPTVSPFHAEGIFHYLRHGFQFIGMITVVTDVVRENNQTYRLSYSEMLKDGTKMGVGSPEYVLLFRRPQTDRTRGYADVPVVKDGDRYTLARWQIDAHAFWRSSGNRLLTADELATIGQDKLAAYFPKWTLLNGEAYDYETHVALGEAIEAKRPGALPRTFMGLAPGSPDPGVWHDVNRMFTLNSEQSVRRLEKHVCPLQQDIIERLVERYSNPGDVVFDPFLGIGSTAYYSLRKGRRAAGVELSEQYWRDAVRYCRAAEQEVSAPSLFDLSAFDGAPQGKTSVSVPVVSKPREAA